MVNKKMFILVSNAYTLKSSVELAVQWYESVIELGKYYYDVQDTTEQIYNNKSMLLMDLMNGNIARLERTYINTFTNVAKYQKV